MKDSVLKGNLNEQHTPAVYGSRKACAKVIRRGCPFGARTNCRGGAMRKGGTKYDVGEIRQALQSCVTDLNGLAQ